MQPEPNFFIVGAPKAGTTSLYHYLDQHPQIYMSPIKEPNYFASEIRPENFCEELQPRVQRDQDELREYLRGPTFQKRFGGIVAEWSDYLRLFQNAGAENAIGEASVCYLWSQTAARNISAKIPSARIVMILRDPVERAFSQYLQMSASGLAPAAFQHPIGDGRLAGDGQLRAMIPHAVANAPSARLDRPAERFDIIHARTLHQPAFGQGRHGNKDSDRDQKSIF